MFTCGFVRSNFSFAIVVVSCSLVWSSGARLVAVAVPGRGRLVSA
jgi:hypothetical protein